MRIKSIVKVMNFHALLRVEKSKKTAEKYIEYEKGLTDFMDNILNNRNLILDKKIKKLNRKGRPLNIYIANDLGFCGNFNSNVNKRAVEDVDCDKIVIGKKIMYNKKNVLLAITKEEYPDNMKKIEEILYDSIENSKNSEINIIYNHYHNISHIELVKKKILPLEKKPKEKSKEKDYKEDFTVEGDINDILKNVIALYLSYEIKVATENSFASENVMRQMITNQSLDKLDEIEEENIKQERKEIKQKDFNKVIDNFIKLKNK